MGRLLFLTFLIVPIIEIGIFIAVGNSIGLLPTLLGIVVTAVLGSFIIRKQGLSLISEIQQLMAAGALPARQIADGLMLAISGALLLTPGFFTDFFGFLLLVPAFRLLIYDALKSRIRVVSGFTSTTQTPFTNRFSSSNPTNEADIVDLDEDNWR